MSNRSVWVNKLMLISLRLRSLLLLKSFEKTLNKLSRSNMTIEPEINNYKEITEELQSSAAHLIASSYYDNPAHIYLWPENETRTSKLEWLLGLNLKLQLKHGAMSFCYPENAKVKALGYWTKPNEVKVGTRQKIKGGLLMVPFKMGWSGFKRVMETTAAVDDHLKRTIGSEQPYYYLNNMVMEESRRGKGWGSKILEKQFEVISRKTPNATLALNTQRYWTVKFYEKLGFEILLEEEIGTGPLAFTSWTMRKIL